MVWGEVTEGFCKIQNYQQEKILAQSLLSEYKKK